MAENQVDKINEELQGLKGSVGSPRSTADVDLTLESGTLPAEGVEYRLKSPLKMRYSAEVEIIKKKFGDLETIRNTLGISQRKMSQLLMVDPSAWTRWTKYDQEAPPHIYRALSWFLLLQEKDPSTGNPYLWLQSVARPSLPKSEILEISSDIKETLLGEAQEQLAEAYKRMRWLFILNVGLLALLVITVLIRI